MCKKSIIKNQLEIAFINKEKRNVSAFTLGFCLGFYRYHAYDTLILKEISA